MRKTRLLGEQPDCWETFRHGGLTCGHTQKLLHEAFVSFSLACIETEVCTAILTLIYLTVILVSSFPASFFTKQALVPP